MVTNGNKFQKDVAKKNICFSKERDGGLMDKKNLSNAQRAWEKKSWMDKLDYGTFDAYLASNDWKKDMARKSATVKAEGALLRPGERKRLGKGHDMEHTQEELVGTG